MDRAALVWLQDVNRAIGTHRERIGARWYIGDAHLRPPREAREIWMGDACR
jgi:hypothetical protein